jgi:hypothetical protein
MKPKKGLDIGLPAHVSDAFLGELNTLLQGDDSFKSRYLREEILSKYLDASVVAPSVRRDAAIKKWLSCERTNAKTNVRLYENMADFGWTTSEELFLEVRSLTKRILGELPKAFNRADGDLRGREILDLSFHTNGASTRIKRGVKSALEKLSGTAHCSSSAVKHWLRLSYDTRIAQNLQITENSVLFTVPKKSDIDRVACKEPEINMLLQRSVGEYIRSRLRRFGVDLNDQTINQDLARKALDLGLATVDLSSASDSITRQLVINSLPFDWWELLNDLRVHSTDVDGTHHSLEMFSSMGNGFTFELESLLFYAITRVVAKSLNVRDRISVYGDDIICSTQVVPRLRVVFAYLGFTMNSKKTHYTGLFRESCGKHYYGGFDVTPFYVRRAIRTLPDLILHLNHLLWWDGRGWGFFLDPDLARFHQKWASFVPRQLHGGIDPEDSSALVTGHRPRHRLVAETRPILYDQQAGLTHWLMMKRCANVTISIDPKIEVGYKTRPIKSRGERTNWTPYLLIEDK